MPNYKSYIKNCTVTVFVHTSTGGKGTADIDMRLNP